MFIVIENNGHNELWSINTDADCKDAATKLKELNIHFAEIWAGEDDEHNDAVNTGRRFFAE